MTCDVVNTLKRMAAAQGRIWQDHPTFAGVRLCRLVDVDDSGGHLMTLLVELAPTAIMEPHVHGGQCEQHLVLAGEGTAVLDRTIAYVPGVLNIIPMGREHAVQAGPDGLTLLAVFSPSP